MQLEVIDQKSGTLSERIDISEQTFGVNFNETLVHQIVTALMAARRAGTHAQKTRAEVRGGGAKPWRQKGTGRARAGTIRSPIWRKGGVIFAAKPRDYTQKVNKKMYKAAMKSIISQLIRDKRLQVLDNITLSEAKTKELVDKLKQLKLTDVLLVIENKDEKLSLAARNLAMVGLTSAAEVNPIALLSYNHVVFTVAALKKLEELFA